MIDGTLLSFLIGAVVGTVLMALVIIPVVVKLKNDHAELEAENKRLSAASKRSLEAYTVIFDERTQLGEKCAELEAKLDGLREPTEEMLVAARDWSYEKYGKLLGDEDD